MRWLWSLALLFLPAFALACERQVCAVPAESLTLPLTITFDDLPAARGPGLPVVGVLALPGASFGEHFAGQTLGADGDFDRVDGAASAPLTLLPGAQGHGLTVLSLPGAKLLSGDGPAGFPRTEATGEGAIAMLFDEDQTSVRLWLRGGEGGAGRVLFLGRDGAVIDAHDLEGLGESPVGFTHAGRGIAGVVLTNRDPEGIALDQVDFGDAEMFSHAQECRQGFSPAPAAAISPACLQISSAA